MDEMFNYDQIDFEFYIHKDKEIMWKVLLFYLN